MIGALMLRNKTELNKILKVPGYYKWWALRSELDLLLKVLGLSFKDVSSGIEKKEDLFCIYVGVANKSVRERINWHINDAHTAARVNSGILSTLRQTIASIVAGNQFDKEATNNFIDKLFIEWFYLDDEDKTRDVRVKLNQIEKQLMNKYFRLLNVKDNQHPLSLLTKSKLKGLRKCSKAKGQKGGLLCLD